MIVNGRQGNPLPRLAFVYHPRSFQTLEIAEAARGLCELIWVVDTSDPDATTMTRILRRLGEVIDISGLSAHEAAVAVGRQRPDGILALADRMLERAAEIAEYLGLDFFSRSTAEALSDKLLQRRVLREAGLAAPGSALLADVRVDAGRESYAALPAAAGPDLRFPLVLKPRRGEGARNTRAIANADELNSVRDDLVAAGSDLGDYIVEEFLPDAGEPSAGDGFAPLVSVETVVSAGTVTPLAVTGRTPFAAPFRETGLFVPSAVAEPTRDDVVRIARAASTALGVTQGVLHTELKLTPTGPVIIEVNGRPGGAIPQILSAAAGVDVLRLTIRLALGETPDVTAFPTTGCVAYRLQVQAPMGAGRLVEVEGLDRLRSHPGVSSVELHRRPGDDVDWAEGSKGYVYSVAGSAEDHDDFRRLLATIPETVHMTWA